MAKKRKPKIKPDEALEALALLTQFAKDHRAKDKIGLLQTFEGHTEPMQHAIEEIFKSK